MYDYAGEWACRVDIPAQSGVGGGAGPAATSQENRDSTRFTS